MNEAKNGHRKSMAEIVFHFDVANHSIPLRQFIDTANSTNSHKNIAFSIEDVAFWRHVNIKDIQPVIRDNMRVQWAYPAGLSKPSRDVRVLRVLSYNGTTISNPMSQSELDRELEEASVIEPETPDLFD